MHRTLEQRTLYGMDVYDFDGTLYQGDSTRDFLMWCVRRYPRVWRTLPRTGVTAVACYYMHAIEKTRFKSSLYRFLPLIPDIEREVERFWDARERLIMGPCSPKPGDLVISAGPEFLMRGMCEARGLELIGSRVDPHTGRVLGPNCSNAEKVTRFQAAYPNATIDRFFSDSHNDDPLAALAREAWFVRDGRLIAWQDA